MTTRPSGLIKRHSDRIKVQRASLPPNERDTLLDCPACEKTGMQMIAEDGRRYRTVVCTWCDGSLVVTPVLYAEFASTRKAGT